MCCWLVCCFDTYLSSLLLTFVPFLYFTSHLLLFSLCSFKPPKPSRTKSQRRPADDPFRNSDDETPSEEDDVVSLHSSDDDIDLEYRRRARENRQMGYWDDKSDISERDYNGYDYSKDVAKKSRRKRRMEEEEQKDGGAAWDDDDSNTRKKERRVHVIQLDGEQEEKAVFRGAFKVTPEKWVSTYGFLKTFACFLLLFTSFFIWNENFNKQPCITETLGGGTGEEVW